MDPKDIKRALLDFIATDIKLAADGIGCSPEELEQTLETMRAAHMGCSHCGLLGRSLHPCNGHLACTVCTLKYAEFNADGTLSKSNTDQ